jgi:hypothetical protein
MTTERPNYLNSDSKLLKHDLLNTFYNKPEQLVKVYEVIKKCNTELSLRVLEWFCSNYSKKNNIIYKVTPKKEINIYLDYKACLNSYSKKKFDPCKRYYEGYGFFNVKVNLPGDPGVKTLETTVGQLNFFRWCIKNKILDYVKKHITDIKNDLNEVTAINYPKKQVKKERKKRNTLSVPAIKTCIKNPSSINTISI